MKLTKALASMSVSCALLFSTILSLALVTTDQHETTGESGVTRRIGTIKAINGKLLTLAPDSGAAITVSVQDAARILRIAPGETNLKNASPIQFQDLQVGDRILVAGRTSEDARSMVASSVLVMKRVDVEARQQQEWQEWQKRGIGGLVSAVDPASGSVAISVMAFGGAKTVTVRTSKSTVIRRYAPNSVKFEDAKLSTLAEIQPGDQLLARGDRSAGGTGLRADEIVSGSFRNVAGIVTSVDASTGAISVQDLLGKKAVQVKITQDSQLRSIPPEMAQRIAARLKEGAAVKPGSNANADGGKASDQKSPAAAKAPVETESARAPDFQQMLSRMPPLALPDLHKGDAVMIVATEGQSSEPGTAITLLSGVDPILQAAPSASQAMLLTPWNLGGAASGDASQ